MLSISAIKSAGGASNYYGKEDYQASVEEGLSRDGEGGTISYYTKEEAVGDGSLQWGGKGAEILGLEGKVDPKDLEQVLERINPDPEGEPLSPKEEQLRRKADGREVDMSKIDDDGPAPYELDPDFHTAEGGAKDPVAGSEKAKEGRDAPPGADASLQTEKAALDPSQVEMGQIVSESLSNWAQMSVAERLEAVRELNNTVKLANGETRQPRHGWDLTFSAPKSVSVLALGEGGDNRLIDAHNESVAVAMRYAEEYMSTYRQRNDKGEVETKVGGNLFHASIQHEVSRAGEKQLHSHVLVANAVYGEDSKWHALDNSMLFEFKHLIGGIYQTHFRHLAKELGYNVRDGRDPDAKGFDGKALTFEIDGVSKEAKDLHSSRHEQVQANIKLAKVEAGGELSHAQEQRAVLTERPDKIKATAAEIWGEWKQWEENIGFKVEQLVAAAKERGLGKDLSLQAKNSIQIWGEKFADLFSARTKTDVSDINDSIRFATAKVFDKTAVATPHDVVLAAMRANGGKYTVEQILAAPAWKEQGFVDASHRGIIDGISTKATLETERQIVSMTKANLNTVTPYNRDTVAEMLSPKELAKIGIEHPLTVGQHEAAMSVLTSPHGISVIQGTAGVGKTTSFQAIQHIYRTLQVVQSVEKVGKPDVTTKMVAALSSDARKASFDKLLEKEAGITGAAPTHTARREMQAKDIQTTTLASLQMRYRAAKASDFKQKKFAELKETFKGATLLVDEASMQGNKAMLELLQMKKDLGIERLVLSGDKMQIASLKAGAAFELIQNKVQPVVTKVTQIVRQKNMTIQKGVELFAEGKGTAALKHVSKYIHEARPEKGANKEQIDKGLAEKAHAIWLKDRSNVLVGVTHSIRGHLNSLVRGTLVSEGKIGGAKAQIPTLKSKGVDEWDRRNAREYSKGDVLVFHTKHENFKRNQVVEVVSIHSENRQNHLMVRDEKTGQVSKIRLDTLAHDKAQVRFDVYSPDQNTYQAGDVIFFNKEDARNKITAKALYDVKQVKENSIVLQKQGKTDAERTTVELNNDNHNLRFSNYGYSMTVDMSQGLSFGKIVAVFNTKIKGDFINATRAYIAGSRPVHDMALVVNNVQEFMKKVGENSGLNKIAVDHLGNATGQIMADNAFAAETRAKLQETRKLAKAKKLEAEKAREAAQVQKEAAPIQGLGADKQMAPAKTDGISDTKGYKPSKEKHIGDMTPVLGGEAAPKKEKKIIRIKVKSL